MHVASPFAERGVRPPRRRYSGPLQPRTGMLFKGLQIEGRTVDSLSPVYRLASRRGTRVGADPRPVARDRRFRTTTEPTPTTAATTATELARPEQPTCRAGSKSGCGYQDAAPVAGVVISGAGAKV